MHPFSQLLLLASIAAAMLGAALVAGSPGQRASRLVAGALACSVFWSLCEVIASLCDDPREARRLIQLSALGWMWLGPLTLHLTAEVVGDPRSRLRRVLPWAYAVAAVSILLYVATPWCLAEPVPTRFGWGVRFGPLFPIVYLPTAAIVTLVLLIWPRLFPPTLSAGERRQVEWIYFAIAAPLGVASTTDVLLPYLHIDVPRLGSASLLVLGAIVAASVRRHGYFLLAPGAFTREILETLRDGVALLHPDGRIRACNAALARFASASPHEIAGTPIASWLPRLPRDPLCEHRDLELELHPQGAAPMPVSISASLLRDERGQCIGCVLAVRDMRELTTLRSRLITSGRLAAVGELAAGIAQEIDAPVSALHAQLAELRVQWRALSTGAGDATLTPLLAEGAELVEESVEGIDRVAAIVREVSAFSHAGPGEAQLVSVHDLLENAVNVAALSFSIVVERYYAELPPVRCDAQQLKQVFLNLLINALQAVGDYGVIRLVTEAQGEFVQIRVEDDGCGIPEDQIERIFDPFFTTRPTGTATGLGLAHCYQIVRRHGGEISVQSKPGAGTTFRIRLPIGT